MDLEQKAIERIKIASEMSLNYYGKPLVCTYSGGKDSDVILELFKRSGVPFEVHNSHTTADAPQTVYHIKNKFKQLEATGIKAEIEYPALSMWQLIPKKLIPPTRYVRYCCSTLKEGANKNRYIATGVRWDESTKRAKREEFERITEKTKNSEKFTKIMLMNDNDTSRRMTELCMQKQSMVVNPIIDWKHTDIWEYIISEKIETNPLYKNGYDRVGCIGCPLAGKKRYKEFADFPKFQQAYIHAFERMLIERKRRGKEDKWKTGYDVFLWWMEDKNIEGQISLFDMEEEQE